MSACRSICTANGWVPLYHYTIPALGQLILDSGLRMSTQGQGDGGVYLSLLGPASFQVLHRCCDLNPKKNVVTFISCRVFVISHKMSSSRAQ